jgi:hypothetical protein
MAAHAAISFFGTSAIIPAINIIKPSSIISAYLEIAFS